MEAGSDSAPEDSRRERGFSTSDSIELGLEIGGQGGQSSIIDSVSRSHCFIANPQSLPAMLEPMKLESATDSLSSSIRLRMPRMDFLISLKPAEHFVLPQSQHVICSARD